LGVVDKISRIIVESFVLENQFRRGKPRSVVQLQAKPVKMRSASKDNIEQMR
jgi:hypothetical protein